MWFFFLESLLEVIRSRLFQTFPEKPHLFTNFRDFSNAQEQNERYEHTENLPWVLVPTETEGTTTLRQNFGPVHRNGRDDVQLQRNIKDTWGLTICGTRGPNSWAIFGLRGPGPVINPRMVSNHIRKWILWLSSEHRLAHGNTNSSIQRARREASKINLFLHHNQCILLSFVIIHRNGDNIVDVVGEKVTYLSIPK